MITIEHHNNPNDVFSNLSAELSSAGASAFGRDAVDFYDDVEAHFASATQGQVIRVSGEVAGFALYSQLPNQGIYLEGIAVSGHHQGKGVGGVALDTFVKKNKIRHISATTRNPATVKLIGSVARFACPDLSKSNPLELFDQEILLEALEHALGRVAPSDSSTLPFLINKYPPGLYGQDPGVRMPLPTIAQNSRNAVVVVGVV